jgi:polysaccharidase protein
MAVTYYIDSSSGSDANAGTSEAAPFRSLAALNNLALAPGDTVLLARGTAYADQLTVKVSGTLGNPISFGAYGEGNPPVIDGPATGVYSSGTHDVIIRDIAIAHTSGYAILGRNVSDWTVDNVTVSNAGSPTHSGAVSFENSSQFAVENSRISGVTGDGILINGGHDIVIRNNSVGTVQGQNGDNIQVAGVSHLTVTGNTLDMSGPTDSTKGNLVVNTSNIVDVEHNTMTGGKYGASVNSDNVTIAFNDIHGQSGYSWSFGIGIGGDWDVRNYSIYNNTIRDVPYGVAITGTTPDVHRYGIDVHNNTFDHIGSAALKVDRAATGDFTHNEIGSDTAPARIANWVSALGTFVVSNNSTFTSSPLSAQAMLAPADAGLPAADKHGLPSVDAHGNFLYPTAAPADAAQHAGAGADLPLHEGPVYGMSDLNMPETTGLNPWMDGHPAYL